MTEAVHWLFTFSSPYHLFWFLLSMSWLCVTLALRGRRWPATYGCIGHAVTVIDALLALAFGYEGPVYSVHCVWFNALMALAHWGIVEYRAIRDDHDETGSP